MLGCHDVADETQASQFYLKLLGTTNTWSCHRLFIHSSLPLTTLTTRGKNSAYFLDFWGHCDKWFKNILTPKNSQKCRPMRSTSSDNSKYRRQKYRRFCWWIVLKLVWYLATGKYFNKYWWRNLFKSWYNRQLNWIGNEKNLFFEKVLCTWFIDIQLIKYTLK